MDIATSTEKTSIAYRCAHQTREYMNLLLEIEDAERRFEETYCDSYVPPVLDTCPPTLRDGAAKHAL